MNVSSWIDRWAARYPDKTAIRFKDKDYSYATLADLVARQAAALHDEFGVRRGDRVAYLGLNRPEVFILMLACARLGALYLPLNWRLTPSEHAYILGNAEPAVLVAERAFTDATSAILPGLSAMTRLVIGGSAEGWLSYENTLTAARSDFSPDAAVSYDDPLLLCYTSGTTGHPKGAILTQNAVFYNAVNSTHMHDLSSRDVILVTLPLFHVGGLNILGMPGLHAGATLIVHPSFDPAAVLETIERERVTLTVLVPAQLRPIIALPQWQTADLSSLRMITTGSVTVGEALISTVHQRGVPVIQVYGSTETSPIAAYQRVEEAEAGIGSSGRCAVHCELAIVDDEGREVPVGVSGEILVRGPNVMIGYWRDPAMTAASLINGWFKTGDVGHYDERGFLFIDDRKKDMIISGGENIYPAILERILAECADLAEAAVVGRPDRRWEEVAVAVVVPRPGARLSAADVLALFEGRIARFAIPKDVLFVEALPKNAMGKVVKSELKVLVAGHLATP
ncbi:MAG: long-chain-fatty-acid--CoA ligase [Sphingomonadales bacterium]|nr:long-chain-fatty-acid--CoA ligase [Sphingomonadales bacterium]